MASLAHFLLLATLAILEPSSCISDDLSDLDIEDGLDLDIDPDQS